jgi:hypothetical protein
VLDLTKVPYCDSAAITMIETIEQERAEHGGSLEVISSV